MSYKTMHDEDGGHERYFGPDSRPIGGGPSANERRALKETGSEILSSTNYDTATSKEQTMIEKDSFTAEEASKLADQFDPMPGILERIMNAAKMGSRKTTTYEKFMSQAIYRKRLEDLGYKIQPLDPCGFQISW